MSDSITMLLFGAVFGFGVGYHVSLHIGTKDLQRRVQLIRKQLSEDEAAFEREASLSD